MEPIEIERAVIRRVRIPMREPFRISNGVVTEKESIIVELRTREHGGRGEASPMGGSFYSGETPESTWNALASDLVPDLFTRRVESPVEYADLLQGYEREPFARAGMEGAMWDLFASTLHTTIRELFGAPRAEIPSGLAVGIYDSIAELLDTIDHYLNDGYRRVKIKIAPGWDIEPLRAVRKRFGTFPLMVDANAAYNLADHADLLRSLDAFDLMMIEQPLAANALEEMAELSRTMRTPICVDESADSLEALEAIIRSGAASIINIKVQRVGGLWNAKKMLDRAREAGLACWLGTMPELGIASAQALAIATLPGFVYPTDIEASARWFTADIIDPEITISNGGSIVSPTVAYRIDQRTLETHTIDIREFER